MDGTADAFVVAIKKVQGAGDGAVADYFISIFCIVFLGDEGKADDKRLVYLVTLPHPKQAVSANGFQLVAPKDFSKAEIMKCLLDACA